MEERHFKAFNAITSFLDDLWSVYSSKHKTPLGLYRRLITHIRITDKAAIEKSIVGFTDFFNKYENAVMERKWDVIPRGVKIKYGKNDKIYIDIQKFIYKSDKDAKEAIRRHLIAISAILVPSEEKKNELMLDNLEVKIDDSTKEGEFLSSLMKQTKETMEGMDASNPMQAMAGLFSSGVIPKMMNGIKSGVENGDMDMTKLLTSMQGFLGNLIPDEKKSDDVKKS